MSGRTSGLGPAAVGDDELAALVAAQLGVATAEILSSSVEAHPYDSPAITTAARHLVTGTARTPEHRVRPYAFFVKVVHAYARSPLRGAVPAALRELAVSMVPWRAEPDLYRAGLRDRLPPGLTMPRAFAVRDLDHDSAALWLERVPVRPVTWDVERHARAANLLGRFAASPAVAEVATAVHGGRTPRAYADGWLAGVVLPVFSGADLWRHPFVAEAFGSPLRRRLEAAFDALPALLDELDEVPVAPAHGDACVANLLVAADRPELVVVDFGFAGRAPLGTDLGQLVLGEVLAGQRSAAEIAALVAACVDGFAAGVTAQGGVVDVTALRRAHAVLMTVFSALSAVPVEHLPADPTPQLRSLVHARAAVASAVLDLLDHTPRPVASGPAR